MNIDYSRSLLGRNSEVPMFQKQQIILPKLCSPQVDKAEKKTKNTAGTGQSATLPSCLKVSNSCQSKTVKYYLSWVFLVSANKGLSQKKEFPLLPNKER